MEQPRRARGGRLPASALPGVEANVVVIAPCREEGGLVPVALGDLKPEHVAIEGDGSFEVADLKEDVADANAGVDWRVVHTFLYA